MLNETIGNQLQNPLTRDGDEQDKSRILNAFHALEPGSTQYSLVLRRYLDSCPEKFFDKKAYDAYLTSLQSWHQKSPTLLKAYFSQFAAEINRSLLFLRELNGEDWHDAPLTSGDDYDLIRIIDRKIHPAYLRLVEGVFTPILRPVAYFSRIQRKRGVDGLDIWSISEEIKGSPQDYLIRHYRHIIRNGVAHGGISFLQREIRYRDQRGNQETFDTSEVTRLFDDLLDTCNGLAAALKVFFLTLQDQGYVPPHELMIEALQELTKAPWWTIEGCVEAEIRGRSQLTLYARPDSRDYRKIFWSTVQSGILSESLAPGYHRYFFSLRSRKALPGWAAFDGCKLKRLREEGTGTLSGYQGIIEGNAISYVPRPALPALLSKVDTFMTSVRIVIPVAIRRIRQNLGIPHIVCRSAVQHRNSWGAVLRASVVVDESDEKELARVIRENCGRITMMARRYARRKSGLKVASLLPLAFAQVAVFRRDFRQRRLSNFGLGEDLVCTVRLQRMTRIKSPDILGSTIEISGKWRIAWSRAWLDFVGNQVLD